ncbi:MAG: beta-ketoacyl synthase N-terminal-like domain-containing protein, partial [Candidatus Tectomicrobia bacterium]
MAASPTCLAVITGIGCVSPFGVGGHDFVADVLSTQRTAISPIAGFSVAGLSRQLGAEVPNQYLPEAEETRRWSRLSQMTVTACREAVTDAALHESETLHRFGLVVGTEFGDLRSTEVFALGFLRKGPLGLSPLVFPNTVMNAMAGTTSIALGLKGPLLTLNQQGVAGEIAVARAIALISAGRAPAVIACGVDELFPMLYETLVQLNLPSPRNGEEEACRPFDQRHNGPVLGEGATAVVLESPEHARARGAPLLAEVYGTSWGGLPALPNRYPSPPHLSRRLLDRAVAEASVRPDEVNVAYLSGSGDPHHDTSELELLVATFGTDSPLITSVTHLTGEYGGLGTFRVAAATVTVTRAVVPPL